LEGLPAYVENLPASDYDGKVDTSLPLLRLAQAEVAEYNTWMVSMIDHGYLDGWIGSIHPMDKAPVGMRLYLSALVNVYGNPLQVKQNSSLCL